MLAIVVVGMVMRTVGAGSFTPVAAATGVRRRIMNVLMSRHVFACATPSIDPYRRNDARRRALARFEAEWSETPTASDEPLLCQCFRRLLPSVPEQYRELLHQIDLEGKEPAHVANALGLTRNNLTVRLHRARKHLRDLLAKNCRACSKHSCLNCTCDEPTSKAGVGLSFQSHKQTRESAMILPCCNGS